MNCDNCNTAWEDDWVNCPHCGWATPPESDAIIIDFDLTPEQAFMRRSADPTHEMVMRTFAEIYAIVTGQKE